MKRFSDLTEQEVLALAITNEEEDSRIYRGFAEGLREQFPSSAKVFDEMAEEEVHHRTMLFDLYRQKFGDYLPLIRRQDVKGFMQPQVAALADAPARARRRAQIRREHGIRGRALSTARRRRPRATPRCASLLIELAEAEAGHEVAGAQAGRDNPHQGRARKGGRDRAAHVRAAIRAAGPGRPDGRLGVDAGAAVRRGLRHPQHLGDLPGRHGGLGRRRHFHGLSPRRCRTTARSPAAARRSPRPVTRRHDRARRARPYVALSHSRTFCTATIVSFVVVAVELAAISWIRTTTWTRRSCRRPSRSWSAACWCSSPAY